MSSSQHVVLITGASSGIGKSTAILLGQNGFRVRPLSLIGEPHFETGIGLW